MTTGTRPPVRVGLNGYGVIGKRVAAAIRQQPDMKLIGVADVFSDWRLGEVARHGYDIFSSTDEAAKAMAAQTATSISGTLDDLLAGVDVLVDCTPKGIGASNALRYLAADVKFVVQGGEAHDVTGHSFVADANYAQAMVATRRESCRATRHPSFARWLAWGR